MALTVGELVGYLRLDNQGWKRGLRDGKQDMAGFQRDANGRLHDMHGRFVKEGQAAGAGWGDGLLRGALPKLKLFDSVLSKLRGSLVAHAIGMSLLGAAAAGATGPLLGLVGTLASAGGAVALLPGILFAAAAAVGVLKLGLSGLGDVLGDVLAGEAVDPEQFAKLAPAARSVVVEVQRLQPALDGLRKTVQQRMFDGLAGEVQALGKAWLPLLREQLANIGQAIGAAFKQAAQAARDATFIQNIALGLDATWLSVARLNDAVGPLVKGFGALVGAAAPFLGPMADSVASLAIEFGEWLQAAQQSGQLTQIIQTALDVLSQLGRIAANVGGILQSLFQAGAASGGGLLNTIETVLNAVNRFLASTEGQTALQSFFASTGQVLSALLPVITTLAGGIGTVLAPAIAKIATALGPALQVLAGALVDALSKIDIGPLAQAFADLLVAVAPLLPVIGQVAGIIAGGLAQALTALMPAITTVVQALIGALGPILPVMAKHFTTLAPVIGAVASVVAGILAGALKALAPLFSQLLPVFATLVQALLPALVPLVELVGQVFAALMPALGPLVELLVATLVPVIQLLTPILGVVATVLGWVLQAVVAIITPIAEFVGWLAELLTATRSWRAVADFFAAAWQTIKDAVAAVVGWLVDQALAQFRLFSTALSASWAGIKAAAAAVWAGIKAAIVVPIQAMYAIVTGLFGKAKSAISNAITQAYNTVKGVAGRFASIGSGIVDGIVSGVRNAASRLYNMLKDVAKNALSSAKKFLGIASPSKLAAATIGEPIGDGVAVGVARATPAVRQAVRQLAASSLGAFDLGAGARASHLGALAQLTGLPLPTVNSPAAPSAGDIYVDVRIGDRVVEDMTIDAIRRRPAETARVVDAGHKLNARLA